jgi:hypothetical protein
MKRKLKDHRRYGPLVAICLLAAALSACSARGGAVAQGGLLPLSSQTQQFAPDLPASLDGANSTTGPVIYIDDSNGILWTVNLSTLAIHRVGNQYYTLTDLGFDPINHVLYGVSFNAFWRVNTTTGLATYVGSLGIYDANALVFDANGKGYTKGFQDTKLYAINHVSTGQTSVIGSTGKWESAGDLTFYNNTLVLSGYTGDINTAKESIITLNPKTGAVQGVAQTDLVQLYGMVSTSANHLYGFAKTSLYRIFPTASTVAQRAVLLKNFAGTGVGQILGAAYNGNFQL